MSLDAACDWASSAGRQSVARRIGAWSRREAARVLVGRGLDLHVTGLEHVPEHGPAILVARHYHHLFDAAAILASVPRQVHVVIAVDWLGGGWRLGLMRWLAAAARWPIVWRRGHGWRLNREGYRCSLELLRAGDLLLVFPEAYPSVDPRGSPKQQAQDFLPFDPGFLLLAERAGCDVPLVPVGLSYARQNADRWTVWLRFGAPIRCAGSGRAGRRMALAELESAVRDLSSIPPG